PEAGKIERFNGLVKVKVYAVVAVTLEGKSRMRAAFYPAGGHLGKVNAQKRKGRIGHGVDQSLHQVLSFRFQFKIFPAKGDDLNLGAEAGGLSHAIAVKAGAVDQVAAFELVGSCLNGELFIRASDISDFLSKANRVAFFFNDGLQFPANRDVINNARTGYVDAFETIDMRLNFVDFLRIDLFNAFNAVNLSGFKDAVKPGDVFLFGSYNHFAANLVLHAACPAKIDQLMPAFHTIFGAVAVGLIVDARMDNARVVARLMRGYMLLLFKDQDIKIGIRFGEL